MDNAAKALIMAGAILISLALVGLGVYIFSISSDLQDNTSQRMDAIAIQTTNAELRNYEGTQVKGSTVKAFLEKVSILNTQNVFPINVEPSDDSDVKSASDVVSNKYYTIVITDEKPNTVDGYVDTYKITSNS